MAGWFKSLTKDHHCWSTRIATLFASFAAPIYADRLWKLSSLDHPPAPQFEQGPKVICSSDSPFGASGASFPCDISLLPSAPHLAVRVLCTSSDDGLL